MLSSPSHVFAHALAALSEVMDNTPDFMIDNDTRWTDQEMRVLIVAVATIALTRRHPDIADAILEDTTLLPEGPDTAIYELADKIALRYHLTAAL